jgi:uncharacterized protein (DUF433 family)
MNTLLSRITIDPALCHGKPCVRGLRYPVETLLELLSSGMTIDEILADYEDLERDDLLAVLAFAAPLSGVVSRRGGRTMTTQDFSSVFAEVVSLSRSECFRLGDLVVCSEHLLLALLQACPAEQLELAGINRSAVKARLEQFLATERDRLGDVVLMGRRGAQTPRVKRALETALVRASSERREVGLRDLWHGLLNDPEARAVMVLAELGHGAEDLLRVLG